RWSRSGAAPKRWHRRWPAAPPSASSVAGTWPRPWPTSAWIRPSPIFRPAEAPPWSFSRAESYPVSLPWRIRDEPHTFGRRQLEDEQDGARLAGPGGRDRGWTAAPGRG